MSPADQQPEAEQPSPAAEAPPTPEVPPSTMESPTPGAPPSTEELPSTEAPPPRRRRGCLRFVLWLLVIVFIFLPLLLAAAAGGGAYYLRHWAHTPQASAPAPAAPASPASASPASASPASSAAATGEVAFIIPPATPTRTIAHQLAERGLVDNEWLFLAWLELSRQRGKMQAGEYTIPQPVTPQGLIELLSRGSFGKRLTIPEGWTARQIAQRLTRDGWIKRPEEWLQLVSQPRTLRLPDAATSGTRAADTRVVTSDTLTALATTTQTRTTATTATAQALHPTAATSRELLLAGGAEGFCFPETYRFERGTSATQILDAMLAEFARQWHAADPTSRTQQAAGLGVEQVVILASMLEREARRTEEMPLIASVYLNRLARGMKLQCCATVYYALGEKWDRPLTLADLRIDSPYNTYQHAGLPPGPIANPSRAAIQAVLRAASSDYLFYVYRGEGRHIFSRTYAEHLKAIREARKGNPQATITKQSDEATTAARKTDHAPAAKSSAAKSPPAKTPKKSTRKAARD